MYKHNRKAICMHALSMHAPCMHAPSKHHTCRYLRVGRVFAWPSPCAVSCSDAVSLSAALLPSSIAERLLAGACPADAAGGGGEGGGDGMGTTLLVTACPPYSTRNWPCAARAARLRAYGMLEAPCRQGGAVQSCPVEGKHVVQYSAVQCRQDTQHSIPGF